MDDFTMIDAAIQHFKGRLDCFASLAMTILKALRRIIELWAYIGLSFIVAGVFFCRVLC